VWVFAEQHHGRLMSVSMEMLGCGHEIADKLNTDLAAVLLGHKVDVLADELVAYGADKVYLAAGELLTFYHSEAYAAIIGELAKRHRPEIFLLGSTSTGRDLAPRLAAKLRTGLTADCVRLDVDDNGQLLQVVPAFGGNVMATVVCPKHRPQMATVRPGVMRAPRTVEERRGRVVKIPVDLKQEDLNIKILDVAEEEPRVAPIQTADIVVAGGWGVGSIDNWRLVEELARSIGAAVGATRPPVDEKWASEDQLIGQSGKTIRPRLYIGIAISGAMQHVVGIQKSKIIVAINKDPNAPIFKAADFGIVADFRELVPPLLEEIRKLRPTMDSATER
jgi:electron transfer flavoprotein alpha subunit